MLFIFLKYSVFNERKVSNSYEFSVFMCMFSHCTNLIPKYLESEGGAIYCCGSNIEVKQSCFINNSVYQNGGAIRIKNSGNSTVIRCGFQDNRVDFYGGSLSLYIVYEFKFEDTNISKDSSQRYVGSSIFTYVQNSFFSNLMVISCVSQELGCFFFENTQAIMKFCSFFSNSATDCTGISIFDDSNIQISQTILYSIQHKSLFVKESQVKMDLSVFHGSSETELIGSISHSRCQFSSLFQRIPFYHITTLSFSQSISPTSTTKPLLTFKAPVHVSLTTFLPYYILSITIVTSLILYTTKMKTIDISIRANTSLLDPDDMNERR